MKAILTFNLPDDEREFQMVTQGSKMHCVLKEMNKWLREQTKYAPDNMSNDTYKAYDTCRQQLLKISIQNGIDLE